TGDHRRLKACARTQHVDLIGPAATIDFDGLDAGEGDDTAGPGDVGIRDHEDVTDGRADDDEGVNPRAAVDHHRGVLEVVVPVIPGAAEELRQVGDLLGFVGGLAPR